MQPDETQRDRQGRQTKTLSGGEKSFSQICLLLSLWEAIGAPIRCLDELSVGPRRTYGNMALTVCSDVFMDSVNREASMKLLVSAYPETLVLVAYRAPDQSGSRFHWTPIRPHHASIYGFYRCHSRCQDHQVSLTKTRQPHRLTVNLGCVTLNVTKEL